MKYYIFEAEDELRIAREMQSRGNVDHHIVAIRSILKENHASLAKIGTSEKDLALLSQTGHLAVAQRKMKRIEANPNAPAAHARLQHLEQELDLANVDIISKMLIISRMITILRDAENPVGEPVVPQELQFTHALVA